MHAIKNTNFEISYLKNNSSQFKSSQLLIDLLLELTNKKQNAESQIISKSIEALDDLAQNIDYIYDKNPNSKAPKLNHLKYYVENALSALENKPYYKETILETLIAVNKSIENNFIHRKEVYRIDRIIENRSTMEYLIPLIRRMFKVTKNEAIDENNLHIFLNYIQIIDDLRDLSSDIKSKNSTPLTEAYDNILINNYCDYQKAISTVFQRAVGLLNMYFESIKSITLELNLNTKSKIFSQIAWFQYQLNNIDVGLDNSDKFKQLEEIIPPILNYSA